MPLEGDGSFADEWMCRVGASCASGFPTNGSRRQRFLQTDFGKPGCRRTFSKPCTPMRELCCASEPTMKALDSVDAAEGAGATSPAARSRLMLTWPGLQGYRYEQLDASPSCRGELHPLKQIHRDIARARLGRDRSMATTRPLVFQALDGVIVCIRCRLTQGNLSRSRLS